MMIYSNPITDGMLARAVYERAQTRRCVEYLEEVIDLAIDAICRGDCDIALGILAQSKAIDGD